MKNETERFWIYLLEKKKLVLTRDEIKNIYAKFILAWKKKDNFQKIFRNLQIFKIKYMWDKKWLILTENQITQLKQGVISESELIFDFLNEEGIVAYVGLSNAKYLNQLTWQSLKTLYIINSKHKIKKKIKGKEIHLIKFPQNLIINMSLKSTKNEIKYSDIEKTLLDEIYLNVYKKNNSQIKDYDFESLDMEKINAYLAFYKKYSLVRATLINFLNTKQLKELI
ncbi:hypothetical protein KAI04_03140 [Candidatus Pacearchaeota archaeon]|nr:hypothetical protein [Candidatus Pacearchaeota archaeon]